MLGVVCLLSFLLDQTGMVLFPYLVVFRILGRISFPLACYLCAYAVRRENNMKLPLALFLTALASETLFNLLCVDRFVAPLEQNPLFSLALGTLCALLLHRWTFSVYERCLILIAGMLLGMALSLRYGWLGPVLIPVFAAAALPRQSASRGALVLLSYTLTLLLSGVNLTWAALSLCSLLALPFVLFHRRSPVPLPLMAFYPCSLLLLLLLRSLHLFSPYFFI